MLRTSLWLSKVPRSRLSGKENYIRRKCWKRRRKMARKEEGNAGKRWKLVGIKKEMKKMPATGRCVDRNWSLLHYLLRLILPWRNFSRRPIFCRGRKNILHRKDKTGGCVALRSWRFVQFGIPYIPSPVNSLATGIFTRMLLMLSEMQKTARKFFRLEQYCAIMVFV